MNPLLCKRLRSLTLTKIRMPSFIKETDSILNHNSAFISESCFVIIAMRQKRRKLLNAYDWLIKLSHNKLSDSNVASELVEDMSFINQFQSKKFEFLWIILLSFKDILIFSLQYPIFIFSRFVHFKDSSVIC